MLVNAGGAKVNTKDMVEFILFYRYILMSIDVNPSFVMLTDMSVTDIA